jgi:hypothetical protein
MKEELEEDSLGDLRTLMNTEHSLDKDKFIKLQNILKIMPELYALAKDNK